MRDDLRREPEPLYDTVASVSTTAPLVINKPDDHPSPKATGST
ncbi:hypothetical protein [Streptomyces sp. NPDC050388]